MKVIDFETKGNVIKLYYGNDDETDYWGDDWDDVPYEHNAELVYEQYVVETREYAFPLDCEVMTPESDWHYGGNSPFSKEDMKNKKCPCLIIKKLSKNDWNVNYSDYLGSEQEDVVKIYFGDKLEKLEEKFYNFEVGFLVRIL